MTLNSKEECSPNGLSQWCSPRCGRIKQRFMRVWHAWSYGVVDRPRIENGSTSIQTNAPRTSFFSISFIWENPVTPISDESSIRENNRLGPTISPWTFCLTLLSCFWKRFTCSRSSSRWAFNVSIRSLSLARSSRRLASLASKQTKEQLYYILAHATYSLKNDVR